jgi:hypothetical protein
VRGDRPGRPSANDGDLCLHMGIPSEAILAGLVEVVKEDAKWVF